MQLQGHCPRCRCWFDVPDSGLNAHRLCPSCLEPATKTRVTSPLLARIRRIAAALNPWRLPTAGV